MDDTDVALPFRDVPVPAVSCATRIEKNYKTVVTLALEEVRTSYPSGHEICVEKFRNA